jgi:hypothetical protein
MTREEKAAKIRAYCDARDITGERCDGCPLYHFEERGCFEEIAKDWVIDRNYRVLFGDKDTEDRPDYWANVCKIQKRQTEKGVKKYGQRLEDNYSLDVIERLEYLEEELIDALMYIEHIKSRIPPYDVKIGEV